MVDPHVFGFLISFPTGYVLSLILHGIFKTSREKRIYLDEMVKTK